MAGPLEELVKRIHRRIDAFREQHARGGGGGQRGADGRVAAPARVALTRSPGFGFLTLCPHAEDGEPEELIVPLGAVREIRLGVAEPPQRLGLLRVCGVVRGYSSRLRDERSTTPHAIVRSGAGSEPAPVPIVCRCVHR